MTSKSEKIPINVIQSQRKIMLLVFQQQKEVQGKYISFFISLRNNHPRSTIGICTQKDFEIYLPVVRSHGPS